LVKCLQQSKKPNCSSDDRAIASLMGTSKSSLTARDAYLMKLPRCLIWGALIAATFQCAFGTKTGEAQKINPPSWQSALSRKRVDRRRIFAAPDLWSRMVCMSSLMLTFWGRKSIRKKENPPRFCRQGENVDVREATKISEDRDPPNWRPVPSCGVGDGGQKNSAQSDD
jgi:hypothetical protein